MTLRLVISLFTAAALVVTPVAAQAPAAASTTSDAYGVLEGKVVSLSGEPLRTATLHLRTAPGPAATAAVNRPAPTSNYSVPSDATGSFHFEGIEPGRYLLLADRNGYVQQLYGARGANRAGLPLTVAAGGRLAGLTITMTPQGIITGRVEDEDGDPLTGVQVMVYRLGYQGGQKQFMPVSSATANPDGTFMAGGLNPGRYYLSATDMHPIMMNGMNERSGNHAPEEGYLTTYYPGSAEQSAATPIDVAAGTEVRGVEI